MKELIHIHNQGSDLRADSRDVAKLFGIQRESLHKLIDLYYCLLFEFLDEFIVRHCYTNTSEIFCETRFNQF